MSQAPGDHSHPGAHSHEHLHRASPDEALATAVDALRARGERVTGARRAVLRVLAHTSEHVSADEVALRLETSDPGVHRATVYRTLDVLTGLGIVSQVHTTSGANVYHFASSPAGSEHLHAHCRVCGSVVVLPADSLTEVAARVAHLTAFRLEPAQSTLVGVCAECAGR